MHFWGSADEVVLEAQKGLEAQSAMVDVFLAAMAGVTAATMSESRKTDLQNHASGRDDHVPSIGTV